MPLPRDGIEFVAQNADQFIAALSGATKATNALGERLGKAPQAAQSAGASMDILSGIMQGVGQQLTNFAVNIVGKVIDGILGIGKAIGQLATDAAKLQGVAAGFGNFAGQTERGAEAMLFALKSASAGMISTGELMRQFNSAAALVNVQFAERLPEAMGLLSKVSAATGEDLNFLLDSLVRGVGRVSPLILDNLKIQVPLAEAAAFGAEMFGKQAEALTKVEQQAALMELTITKLTEKFGGLPDVTQSATANLARINAMFENIRGQLGAAFLPAWTTMTNAVANAVGFFSDAISEGGALFPVLANLGAAASLMAEGFERGVLDLINFIDDVQMSLSDGLSETADNALNWGIDIATSFAQGLIDGAASALTVAMNFISGMLSGWLAPGSPPMVAPDLPEWGIGAMTSYLEGFTEADFGILKGIQGPLSKVLGDVEFAEISQEIARAISAGVVDEGLFATIEASAGEFGTEIADLARLQFELVEATDALTAAELAQAQATDVVVAAQERLNASTEAVEDSQAEVASLTAEYNQLLREGADPAALDAQLALINAAEEQRDAAIEQNRAATEGLETAETVQAQRETEAEAARAAAQAEVEAARERLKNQEALVNQLIALSQKALGIETPEQKEARKRALKGKKGAITPEAIVPPDLGALVPFDFTGGLTAAIEAAKLTLAEKFGGIFDPIKEIIAAKFGPESEIGQLWGTIGDQIKAVWDEKLVPFWEGTLLPAVETVQGAFDNLQTFWETSTIPAIAGEAFGIFIDNVMELASRIIPWFVTQIEKISAWFVDNGPMIEIVLEALVEAWGIVAGAIVELWDVVEPILTGMVDTVLNMGTILLAFFTGDWELAWETAEQIVADGFANMEEVFEEFLDFIVKLLGGESWQAVEDMWQANFDQWLLIVTTLGEDILANLGIIVGAISAWITEKAETFKQWGRDMVDGLVGGIVGKIESVIGVVSSLVGAALAAAKKALGIGSKSTVFAGFGTNAVEGFISGILAAQQMMQSQISAMFSAPALQPVIQPMLASGQLALQQAQPIMRSVSIQIGPNIIQGMNDREFVQRVQQVIRNELRSN